MHAFYYVRGGRGEGRGEDPPTKPHTNRHSKVLTTLKEDQEEAASRQPRQDPASATDTTTIPLTTSDCWTNSSTLAVKGNKNSSNK